MKKFLGFLFFLGIIGVAGWFFFGSEEPAVADIVKEEVIVENPEEVEEYVISDGDVFTSAAEVLGIDYADALAIVAAAEEVFDFTSIKLGKPLRLISQDGKRLRLEYEPGTETVVKVDLTDGKFTTTREDIAYDVIVERVAGRVTESLYKNALEDGVDELVVLAFAEAFAWTVDFAVEVREGDTYEILYERRYRDGEPSGIGDILAASYTNVGETDWGYRFIDSDGVTGYYDDEGNSLVKQFLKAPLSYSRITSGFTYSRFHPTLKKNTPHRAIDYAAPMGTPIMAVGDGTIKAYRYNGGYGNFVSVSHNERFTTNYAHLSRYAQGLGVGSKVKQGDIIGYVGSTGFSTGPHLHYEIEEFGTLVNPLEVELPPGDPVKDEDRAAFEAERDRLHKELLGK